MANFSDIYSETLHTKNGEVKGDSLNNKVILLYFSAHWCPPCRGFTPLLKKYYEGLEDKPVAVVFVSCDRDEDSMMSYFKNDHGDYYCLRFNSPLRQSLPEKYGVRGIPSLIVVDKTGEVICDNAREVVQNDNFNAFDEWQKQILG